MALIPGLSLPLLTALKADGSLDPASQEKLVAWSLQKGQGADVLFSAGTTGEWNRMAPRQVRDLNALCLGALAKARAGLASRPEFWAGVTAEDGDECLRSLEDAIRIGAAAAVLAPLSLKGVPEPVPYFHGRIVPLFERLGASIPLCLYDNGEIAQKSGEHMHTRDVKQLSRLDFVVGVKVSAGPKVVGNYLKAARHFKQRHEFGVYLGNANLCFDLFRVPRGLAGHALHFWNRMWLRQELPVGVVAGPANLFPREWKRAWKACLAGEEALMRAFQGSFEALSAAWRFESGGKKVSKSIACMKAALKAEGILQDGSVATGTPALTAAEEVLWMQRYQEVKRGLAAVTPEGWHSQWG